MSALPMSSGGGTYGPMPKGKWLDGHYNSPPNFYDIPYNTWVNAGYRPSILNGKDCTSITISDIYCVAFSSNGDFGNYSTSGTYDLSNYESVMVWTTSAPAYAGKWKVNK